jgi:hypothetical protein
MKSTIKRMIKPLVPQFIFRQLKKTEEAKEIVIWTKNGCPAPPPHAIKQKIIADYQQESGFSTLIETGTYLGDMVEAQRSRFKKVISIELGQDLFEKAKNRFRKNKNVSIMQGDSGTVLPIIMKDLNEPAIFWLDGHYSAGITAQGDKDCPIFEELDAIFQGKKFDHILLVDDARCFTGEGDYPTIEKLTSYVKSKNDKYRVEVKHDVIRFVV